MMGNSDAQKAITANDYTAFIATIKGSPMEGKITQEQFNHMVLAQKRRTAIDAAIEKNDYAAFVEANKVSESEFTQMVKMHKERPAQPQEKTAQ